MILQKVTNILAEILGINDEDISAQTTLTSSHGIKPVDLAKLVIDCEKRFNMTIHDEDVHQFQSVNDLVAYIQKAKSDL